ncbi:MAG: alpha/beta hydrolase [Thermodesulfobacteriota bacterium]|nr:alpha/beta hydrolase [Thermodesulfobacteriota bacterium]MEA3416244.1 alpha/beta hydrolase [Thermodesulfobacteriota bacterium]
MKNDITILLVPGLGGSGPDHWQSIWEQNIPGSRRVYFKDWDQPKISEWMRKFDETVRGHKKINYARSVFRRCE